MKSSLYKLLVIFTAFMSGNALANDWQALLVSDLQDKSSELSVSEVINDKLIDAFTRQQVALVSPSALSLNCALPNCGEKSLMSLSSRVLKTHPDINLLVLYKLRQERTGMNDELVMRLKAVDPVSGVVIFSAGISEEFEKEVSTSTIRHLSEKLALTLGERFSATIARSAKRYSYTVSMKEFTPEESRVLSSLLLPSAANISTTLLTEETHNHFLRLLLPTKDISFRVTSPLTPAKFRQQAAGLSQRLGLEANIRFIQQDSLFELTRAQPAYFWQNLGLWLVFIAIIYLVLLLLLRFWIEINLRRYARENECGRWLTLLDTIQKVPFPFLVSKSWKNKISHFEKRVEQSRMWFDNATNLLQNNEVESANVFVKRALEQNASNISARALENAISEQQSKHQEIKDERELWKELVSSAVSFAKQNNTFLALEKAYTALDLCKSHEKYNRPVIDLQIDSIKKLIERISANKSALCEGLVISAKKQQLIINTSSQMHIGRPNKNSPLNQDLHLQLPQSNLSRLGQSAAVTRQDAGHFSLVDIGASNGVWLQYKNIETERDYVLEEMNQIHLLPPDDLGTIALQVAYVRGDSCLALCLSQNSMLPRGSKMGAVGFLNPSIYEHTLWYLCREVFILVKREHDCMWYSESQWAQYHDEAISRDEKSLLLPVASLQIDGGVYLDRIDDRTQESLVIKVNGAELKGKVPIMDNVTIQVDNYVATLTLHPVSKSQISGIGFASKSEKEQFKK